MAAVGIHGAAGCLVARLEAAEEIEIVADHGGRALHPAGGRWLASGESSVGLVAPRTAPAHGRRQEQERVSPHGAEGTEHRDLGKGVRIHPRLAPFEIMGRNTELRRMMANEAKPARRFGNFSRRTRSATWTCCLPCGRWSVAGMICPPDDDGPSTAAGYGVLARAVENAMGATRPGNVTVG